MALLGIVAVLTTVSAGATLAVHDEGVFELDRNAVDGAAAGEDWNKVCPATTPAGIAPGCLGGTTADVSSFVVDPDGATIFTTGGSKDDLDVTSWRHTSGSVPDKDELHHGFAARYDEAGADSDKSLLYFGADRNAANGDAQMAVWFFQSAVGAVAGGTFSGAHKDGDILVLSDFTKGGGLPTVRVFEWNGPGGDIPGSGAINGTLDLLFGTVESPQDCVASNLADDPACATVNAATADSPWAFQSKSSKAAANTFPSGHFYEGGIDLTALELDDECFSSFLIETRSSQSVDATLKDFVGGSFESCGASIATQVSDDSFEIGGSVSDSATVTVTGGANPPAPTGSVVFKVGTTTVSTVNLGTAVKVGNTYTVQSGSFTPTAAGSYCFTASWAGDSNYTGPFVDDGTNECFTVTPKQPTISTQVNDAGPVTPGTTLFDTATLAGTTTPSNGVFGSITFTAYGPHANATTCTTVAYTSTIAVTGNGSYSSADGNGGTFAPTQPGNYNWIASYTPGTGDVNNLSVTGACGDANEGSVVQQFNPSLTTVQTWTVKDTATITVSGGGNLTGTAHFELWDGADCTGTKLYEQDVAVSGASPQSPATTPFTITTSKPTLWWKVSYASTNGAQTGIAASCVENSSLTIDND